jgi:hypothetical protein
MSSSRSVAAARARRAPETPSQSAFKPQMAQQRQQQQPQLSRVATAAATNAAIATGGKAPMTPYQPQQSSIENRLSVSDAFALVTLRLGRVELLLQKWQTMGVETDGAVHIPAATSSAPDLNNTIVKSLVSRIDDLERSVKAAVSMKDFEAKISMLSDRNTHLLNELRDAKDTIFKLQTITLETSQKMMQMMMSKSAPEVVAVPSSAEMQDDVDEGLELEETYEGDEELVEGDAGQENVSLQVEGQTA